MPKGGCCSGLFSFLVDHPSRDSMTPPQLARNTPRLTLSQPVVPSRLELLRDNFKTLFFDSFNSLSSHIFSVDPPLRFQHRLNEIPRTRADRKNHRVVTDFIMPSLSLQILTNRNPGIISLHPLKLLASDLCNQPLVGQNVQLFQTMSFSALKIVGIMSWCKFDTTSSKIHVDQLRVKNDGEGAVAVGVPNKFLVPFFVSLILRVNCNACISQHSLQTSCRNNHDILFPIFAQNWRSICLTNSIPKILNDTKIKTIPWISGDLSLCFP
mmetsp:Transcript_13616/g.21080  ORF Transcript_13616/g.21080 Transcript_13616/m.21080 type:complete len:268 (-) Transcript_13616:1143-1946(-)